MRWRIPNNDNRGPKVQTSRYEAMGTDKRTSDVQTLGEKTLGSTTQTLKGRERGNKVYQEKGLVNTIEEIPKESCAILVKESMD